MDLEPLIDRIYQAPTAPDTWPSVLYDVSKSVDGSGGALITRRNDNWTGWRLSPDIPAFAADYLRSEAATRSQTTPRLLAANHAGFLSDGDFFTREEYNTDSFIAEFGRAAGLHHAAATAIIVPNADLMVFQVQRRTGEAPFSATDIAILDTLRPHLARAGMLAVRWQLERLTAATEALALIGLPAAVLNLNGAVLAANSLADNLSSYILWRTNDRIALLDRTANALLERAVADLGYPSRASVRSIPIRATASAEAAIVHVIPTTGTARDFFGGGFGILAITKLQAPGPLDIGLVQGLFDLTSAEAKLASGLAEGLTLDGIAGRYGISFETVRSHLKAVFTKTGMRRQSDVAALLARLPVVK